MRRKGFIEFCSDTAQFGETCPGDGREIVVLVVVADLEKSVCLVGMAIQAL